MVIDGLVYLWPFEKLILFLDYFFPLMVKKILLKIYGCINEDSDSYDGSNSIICGSNG